jgi:hypothetical protein
MLPRDGIIYHCGVSAVSALHLADKRVAEEPEREVVGQRHGKVSVRANPTVRALKKAVKFRRAGGEPICAARRHAKKNRQRNCGYSKQF